MPKTQKSQFLSHSENDAKAIHEALPRSSVFESLQFQGIQTGLEGTYYQVRLCPSCGSSINGEVSLKKALGLLAHASFVVAQTLSNLDLPDNVAGLSGVSP